MILEKKAQLIKLYTVYGKLLTKKQKLYFKYYIEDDYSFDEISKILSVSKSAAHDQLRKIRDKLLMFENKLNILSKNDIRKKILKNYKKTKDERILEDLIENDYN
jgi:predicted DNA-binding protein YlxM (UPF0122 family)